MPGNERSSSLKADALLARGDMEIVGRMRWSSNATFLARLVHGDEEGLAVYKPDRGERPLWDFPSGTLCRREMASFELSEALGWSIVPTTVLREGPAGWGMVQRFIEHDPEEHYFTLQQSETNRFAAFAVFDIVVNNADRKAGHCIRAVDGKIWGIDHGLTFHVEPKLRTVIWDYAGLEIPETLLADVLRVRDLLGDCDLGVRLLELLGAEEVEEIAHRMAALLDGGVFPHPTSRYDLPWPVV